MPRRPRRTRALAASRLAGHARQAGVDSSGSRQRVDAFRATKSTRSFSPRCTRRHRSAGLSVSTLQVDVRHEEARDEDERRRQKAQVAVAAPLEADEVVQPVIQDHEEDERIP